LENLNPKEHRKLVAYCKWNQNWDFGTNLLLKLNYNSNFFGTSFGFQCNQVVNFVAMLFCKHESITCLLILIFFAIFKEIIEFVAMHFKFSQKKVKPLLIHI